MTDHVDIVFDGPPEHAAGRFVEVEDAQGQGLKFGEWVERPDGYWALRIDLDDVRAEAWDGGYEAAMADDRKVNLTRFTPNPYRKEEQ